MATEAASATTTAVAPAADTTVIRMRGLVTRFGAQLVLSLIHI